MPLTVELAVEHGAWTTHPAAPATLDETTLAALARRAIAAAAAEAARAGLDVPDGAEVSLVFADDAFIRELNRQWRGVDRATNVLAFPAAPPARARTLGDVVVAFETVAREAAERGLPLADHLAHLLVHGTLHLLGLDHGEDDAAEAMEAMEARALAGLGIASPHGDAGAPLLGLTGNAA